MRMIDCFFQVLADTVGFIDSIKKNESIDYETLRLTIERSLSEHSSDYFRGGYSQEQYDLAKYAVLSFIDEAILSSSWEHKAQWKNEMLQKQHFQTVSAGQTFFDNLNSLNPVNPAEKDIREVYYYCLVLGFKGKYYRDDDKFKLDELKEVNLNLLTSLRDGGTPSDFLFPESIVPGVKGSGIRDTKSIKTFYYGIPVILIVILFFIFKSEIIDLANYLVTII